MRLAQAFIGFVVAAAYWPGLSGAAVAPRYAAMVGASALLLSGRGIRMNAVVFAALAFLSWIFVTALWSPYPLDAICALGQWAILAGVFALGTQVDDAAPVMTGLALGLGVSSLIVLAQVAGWHGLPELDTPSGLFYNKNWLAEAAAPVFVWLCVRRRFYLALLVAPCVTLTCGRAAWLGMGIALLVFAWPRSKYLALSTGAALAVLAAAAIALHHSGTDSIAERVAFWRDTAEHVTPFGWGIGSFPQAYLRIARHYVIVSERPFHPHNEFLWAAFELGIVGLVLFSALIVLLLRSSAESERLALIAVIGESLFAFPLHEPASAFAALFLAGFAARRRPVLRDAPARSRVSLYARLLRGERSFPRHA